MRSRTSNWYETKVSYDKTQEDGTKKRVTEIYVVDALSFAEAEASITQEMESYVSGEYKVTNITPAVYHEVFFSDNNADGKWYKAKLVFVSIDEKTEKEKRSFVIYLIQGNTLASAVRSITEIMQGTMIDYYTHSIAETNVMDVFEHKPKGKKNA